MQVESRNAQAAADTLAAVQTEAAAARDLAEEQKGLAKRQNERADTAVLERETAVREKQELAVKLAGLHQSSKVRPHV